MTNVTEESPGLTRDDVAGVRRPFPDAHWLPARAYTDNKVWRQELRQIFSREWLVVGRIDQVKRPGSYFCKEIAGVRVLVVRGADHIVRAFHNVCRHRGMWVAEDGGDTNRFVCPYHGWTYALDGCLVAAPEMARTRGFNLEDYPLKAIRCETWQGFVAINLNADAPPFGTDLEDLAEIIAPWELGEMITANERIFATTWDWKLMWENAIEGYHTSCLHRESAGEGIPTALSWVSEDLDGRAWSDLHHPFSDTGTREVPDAPVILDNLPDFAARELVFFHVWPCLGFYVSPDMVTAYICEPVAPGRHRYVMQFYSPPQAKQKDSYDDWRENIAARFDIIQSEDEMACRGVQAAMDSGVWTPGRYSDKERACWHFHRWYADRMLGQ